MLNGRVPKKNTENVVPNDPFEEDFNEHANKFILSPIKDGHLLSYTQK